MSPNGKVAPNSTDAYLLRLRAALRGLPDSEIEEILREIRGHILERQEGGDRGDSERLPQILCELGSPEDIGALYRTEALVARARATFSPVLILGSAVRLATKSLIGFLSLMLGLVGYVTAAGFLWCAGAKPFLPDRIGLWRSQYRFSMGIIPPSEHAQELLGWWIIPVGLILGITVIVVTTALLRWMLRYALPAPAARFMRVK
jgi:uncharacterized membrane protein